jgi:hypothetical protein
MSRIIVNYEASQEIEQIIKGVEQHIDMKKDESEIYGLVQKIIQAAFEEGRKFQKQISISSSVKDSIIGKTDI